MSEQTIDERQSRSSDERQSPFSDIVAVGVYSILILLIMLAWASVPA